MNLKSIFLNAIIGFSAGGFLGAFLTPKITIFSHDAIVMGTAVTIALLMVVLEIKDQRKQKTE
jgi:uncharacterized membrane protein YoaK (UPF0700 family)